MVIDTSAFLTAPQNEPELRQFTEGIETVDSRLVSAASYVECSMILESRYGAEGMRDLDHFIARAQITIVPVDADQARIARDAFRRYGKGCHRVGLNFGDCFSYALSRTVDQALPFMGDDFPHTDVDCHTTTQPSVHEPGTGAAPGSRRD